MARRVACTSRSMRAYREIVDEPLLAEVAEVARPLRGARVLHLNATACGGGVAELLRSLIPLLRGLGLDAEWHVLSGDDAFFGITKTLHNALQGKTSEFPPSLRAVYLETLEANLDLFGRDWDFVVVHDPQPAGLIGLLDGRRTGHWVWRCHVDTTEPCPAAIDFLAPYVSAFDAAIFTRPEYAAGWRR
ncbi:MAG: glycosyl transferase family 1, partial [Gemmatimonadota bacterium]